MEKYWTLSVVFMLTLFVSSVIIKSTSQQYGKVLGVSTATGSALMLRPTEMIHTSNASASSTLLQRLKSSQGEKTTTEKKPPLATPSGMVGAYKEAVTARLNEQKLKICKERSTPILKRSTQLTEMVGKTLVHYTSVLDSVKVYYIKRNLFLVSYEELVGVAETRKASITPLIASAQGDITSFNCTGVNPTEHIKKYRDDMQLVIHALAEYRTSIRILIDAIKDIASPTIQK